MTYPSLGYTSESRFTMVGYGRVGAQVAIGHRDADGHVVRIVRPEDPAFYLARDVIEIMTRL